MKSMIVRFLLAILNHPWLNPSPCRYGFIGNVDAFEYSNLASEYKMRPGITVKTVLEEADRFRSCPISKNGLTVIEPGGYRPATAFDLRDLRESLKTPKST